MREFAPREQIKKSVCVFLSITLFDIVSPIAQTFDTYYIWNKSIARESNRYTNVLYLNKLQSKVGICKGLFDFLTFIFLSIVPLFAHSLSLDQKVLFIFFLSSCSKFIGERRFSFSLFVCLSRCVCWFRCCSFDAPVYPQAYFDGFLRLNAINYSYTSIAWWHQRFFFLLDKQLNSN